MDIALPLFSVIKGNRTSDGNARGPAELIETVVVFKNEFGSGVR